MLQGADVLLAYIKVEELPKTAVVKQIMNNVTDASHNVAGITSTRLLSAGTPNGLLFGPRSPLYGKDNAN